MRYWLTIFDCCQPMCVGRRRRRTTIRLPARPRFALPEPAVPLPARNLPDSVVVSQRGAVTLVRLSRPAKRNALDIEMMVGIEKRLPKVVPLFGEGEP